MPVPKVSVIIPTKNRINATIRSIESVIAQSISPYEIIVIDDGSTDETYNVISKKYPKVLLIRNATSRGGAVARNQGSEMASGNYLAFLDSDDEWMRDHLVNKIDIIRRTDADGVFGTFLLIKGKVEQPIKFKVDFSKNGNIGNSILSATRFDARTSTFVFKREAFLKIKFDENLKKHQDWDLAINFDKDFNFELDKLPSIKIYVEQGEDRMSQKLQHDSSFYFINKNAKSIDDDNIFMFCLKQIMRSQMAKEPRVIIQKYLNVIRLRLKHISFRNKIIYFLLKFKLINMAYVYRLTQF